MTQHFTLRVMFSHKAEFDQIDTWVFDLDNTLYPACARLFDQIETRMTDYVMRVLGVPHSEADRLRSAYWRQHGTTLAGLMIEHDIDPMPYLEEVHDISMAMLQPDPTLRAQIKSLPGRKIVYTNGYAPYAERVISARGLTGAFDAVFGVEHAGFVPKPKSEAFEQIFAKGGVAPTKAAMFEDEERNLLVPFAMGMRTVHVAPDPISAPHIHHGTDDLSRFLGELL